MLKSFTFFNVHVCMCMDVLNNRRLFLVKNNQVEDPLYHPYYYHCEFSSQLGRPHRPLRGTFLSFTPLQVP